MSFWIISVIFLIAAIIPLMMLALKKANIEPENATHSNATEINIYKQQLQELERDLSIGAILPEDAERSRLEIHKRILKADKEHSNIKAPQSGSARLPKIVFAGVFVFITAMTYVVYISVGNPSYQDLPLKKRLEIAQDAYDSRPTQDELEAIYLSRSTRPAPDPEHLAQVQKMREVLSKRPNDLEGLQILIRNELILGNLREAYQLQDQFILAKGQNVTFTDYEILSDLMIQAAAGIVSKEVEAILNAIVQQDPLNGTANYYLGVLYFQTGRPDLAFSYWRPLIERSSITDPWYSPIRNQIERVAALAGQKYDASFLSSGSALPELSLEQVEAMSELSEVERQERIDMMISALASKLANHGGTAQEWAKLIEVLVVNNDRDRAEAIWQEAQNVFSAQTNLLNMINNTAERAGLELKDTLEQ